MSQGTLFNMSVPSTSRITVARAILPGLRFRVRLHEQVRRRSLLASRRLAKKGWQAAWDLLEDAGGAPRREPKTRRRRDLLEQHLGQAVAAAGIPDRLGLFVHEDGEAGVGTLLPPAAALAVLARRSGPLYLPSRHLDPSLADPKPFVLFFPEESE